MESIIRTMINCIKYEVCGQKENVVLPDVSVKFLTELYKLSKAHDAAHLVGAALEKSGVLFDGEIKNKFDNQVFTAIYRYENINAELEEIREILREENIDFIPLKGAFIRKYYPEPWMRTSSDIDILIHENDLQTAINALSEKKGFTVEEKGSHDVGMFSESGVHLELHYSLIESYVMDEAEKILAEVWTYAERVDKTCEYRLKDEAFYYYHIAHMAKHVMHGGCGVKPFVDLWVLEHKVEHSDEKRKELLSRGGLEKFAEAARALSKAWFEDGEHTDVTKELENFVLSGGVYGTLENSVSVGQNKKGGKIKYILSRVWLSYDVLKIQYPNLEKHKWLLPFYEVKRWFRLLFKGGVKRSVNEIKVTANMDSEKVERSARLMSELGLIERKK